MTRTSRSKRPCASRGIQKGSIVFNCPDDAVWHCPSCHCDRCSAHAPGGYCHECGSLCERDSVPKGRTVKKLHVTTELLNHSSRFWTLCGLEIERVYIAPSAQDATCKTCQKVLGFVREIKEWKPQ